MKRASYGMSFVDLASDWYSASVPVIIFVISYNIGPCYKGTDCICNISTIWDSVITRADCIPRYHPNKYLQPIVDAIPHKHVAVDLTHWPRKTNVYTVTQCDGCVQLHQARNICTQWPRKTNENMITKEDLFISQQKWNIFMSCKCRFLTDQ